MKSDRIQIRLGEGMREQIEKLAPEGNVAMWIRLLIQKELETNQIKLK